MEKGFCVGLAGAQHSECHCCDAAGCGLLNSAGQKRLEVKEEGRGLGLRHGEKMGNVFYLADAGDLVLE